MRFYNSQHQYYCGIDLHTKNMYVCIVNQVGKTLYHHNLPAHPHALLSIIKPYLPDIVIAVECVFTWYWIADFCSQQNIPFVLGHALYMYQRHPLRERPFMGVKQRTIKSILRKSPCCSEQG